MNCVICGREGCFNWGGGENSEFTATLVLFDKLLTSFCENSDGGRDGGNKVDSHLDILLHCGSLEEQLGSCEECCGCLSTILKLQKMIQEHQASQRQYVQLLQKSLLNSVTSNVGNTCWRQIREQLLEHCYLDLEGVEVKQENEARNVDTGRDNDALLMDSLDGDQLSQATVDQSSCFGKSQGNSDVEEIVKTKLEGHHHIYPARQKLRARGSSPPGSSQSSVGVAQAQSSSHKPMNTLTKRKTTKRGKTQPGIKKLECKICLKMCATRWELKIHEETHIPQELRKNLECPECEKKFIRVDSLRAHMDTVHNRQLVRRRQKVCPIYGKTYHPCRTQAYQFHMLTHSGEKPFQCDTCGKSFNSKSGLNEHSVNIHTTKKYLCEHCPMVCKNKRSLKHHMSFTHKDKALQKNPTWATSKPENRPGFIGPKMAYPCEVCNKVFQLKCYLTKHQKTHVITKTL